MRPRVRPVLMSKLTTWREAYQLVLDELCHDYERSTGFHAANNGAAYGTLQAAAARTAAILIQGTEEAYGDQGR